MKQRPFRFEDAIDDLADLLTVCSDGVEGYRHAAAAIAEPELHAALEHAAAEREETVAALTYTLVDLGYKPKHRGSVKGAVHRGCLDALGVLHPQASTVLRECERGEQASLLAFEAVLGHALPAIVRPVVQAQYGRILQSVEALRGWMGEKAAKAS